VSKVAEVLQALREEEQHLRAELSRVERAISALEEAMGTVAPAKQAEAAPGPPPPAPPAGPGPYALLRFNEAAAEYLASVNEPKTAAEIADALRAGGFPTKSKDFAASVRTMLNRTDSYIHGIEHMDDGKWRFVGRGERPGASS